MKRSPTVVDLADPLREISSTLRLLAEHLVKLRHSAAALRAADNIRTLSEIGDRERDLVYEIGTAQMSIDTLAESVSHAHARLTEARAHIAVANKACADVAKLADAVKPPTGSAPS